MTQSLFVWGDWGVRDPLVGYLPLKPGISVRHPSKHFVATIGAYGTRSNGSDIALPERPVILAVGDSFTFGEDVGDAASWPAALERRLHRRVINGGVPGFGIDQSVLRAEQLTMAYQPNAVILSFIPHDVARSEMSVYAGHAKPYFTVEKGRLRYHPASRLRLSWFKRILSYSVAARLALDRYFAEGPDTVVHHDGRSVACLLMARLAALGRARRIDVIVVAQAQTPLESPARVATKEHVLECARRNGLSTVDLVASETGRRAEEIFFPHGHLNAKGNGAVAAALASFISDSGAVQKVDSTAPR